MENTEILLDREGLQEEVRKAATEKEDIVKRVDELRAQGMTVVDAMKQVSNRHWSYYYSLKKKSGRGSGRKNVFRSKDEKIQLIRDFDNRGNITAQSWFKANGVSGGSIMQWKKKLGAHPVEDLREVVEVPVHKGNNEELKRLRIENERLRKLVVEYAIDIQAMKDYMGRDK